MALKLSDLKTRKRLKLMLVGESGVGKSWLASTAERWGSVYVFDLDDRSESLYEKYKNTEASPNIELDTYLFHKEALASFHRVEEKLDELAEYFRKNNKPKYTTVIFDSWTSWELLALTATIERNTVGVDAKGNKLFSDEFSHVPFSALTAGSRNDYGDHAQYQRTFVQKLLSCTFPSNIILVCHLADKQVKAGNQFVTKQQVGATGQLAKNLAIGFNEVNVLKKIGLKRHLVVDGSDISCFKSTLGLKTPSIAVEDLSIFDSKAFVLESTKPDDADQSLNMKGEVKE